MTTFLREWLLSVLAVAMVLALLLAVMPKGTVRQVGSLAVGMVLFLVILRPMLQAVPEKLLASLEEQYIQASVYPDGLELANERYLESIMSQRCAEYIVSRAEGLGCSVEVVVECTLSGGYPVPKAVTICGVVDVPSQNALEQEIYTQLGISPENVTYEEAAA